MRHRRSLANAVLSNCHEESPRWLIAVRSFEAHSSSIRNVLPVSEVGTLANCAKARSWVFNVDFVDISDEVCFWLLP
jgi:hypothetical protein